MVSQRLRASTLTIEREGISLEESWLPTALPLTYVVHSTSFKLVLCTTAVDYANESKAFKKERAKGWCRTRDEPKSHGCDFGKRSGSD